MNEFELFHTYNRLAKQGLANALMCPICETEYITRAKGDDIHLMLWCMFCDTWTLPGLKMREMVRAVVSEWYDLS